MSLRQLNLATRPFRNERLPALLLALAFTVAGAVTLKHALMVRRLMPGRTSGLARQVDDLEAERARLGSEVARLRAPRPEPAVLGRWTRLTELVDRRAFSWSRLFATLEEVLPNGVRISSISPHIEKSGLMTLDLQVVTRNNEDMLELIRLLDERPEFDNVLPRSWSRGSDQELTFHLAADYHPQAGPPAAASPAPGASAAPPAGTSPAPPSSPAASPAASPAGPVARAPSPSARPAVAGREAAR